MRRAQPRRDPAALSAAEARPGAARMPLPPQAKRRARGAIVSPRTANIRGEPLLSRNSKVKNAIRQIVSRGRTYVKILNPIPGELPISANTERRGGTRRPRPGLYVHLSGMARLSNVNISPRRGGWGNRVSPHPRPREGLALQQGNGETRFPHSPTPREDLERLRPPRNNRFASRGGAGKPGFPTPPESTALTLPGRYAILPPRS